ncbi:MAG: hypothetical protein LBF24_01845 [Puniceicoccales bacterium]|jgi:hypothetical protein|nr:hypothetical protein [Puniceicoccales bacterium]
MLETLEMNAISNVSEIRGNAGEKQKNVDGICCLSVSYVMNGGKISTNGRRLIYALGRYYLVPSKAPMGAFVNFKRCVPLNLAVAEDLEDTWQCGGVVNQGQFEKYYRSALFWCPALKDIATRRGLIELNQCLLDYVMAKHDIDWLAAR